ncbi:hypothetical protein ACUNWD_14765 [Sunxiuqinia sp. A32]|uniref:hypothetical protein n=1 Tax=Sunxiuqinia sp. A32 TaxID=3461496 RepID=UPI0040467107
MNNLALDIDITQVEQVKSKLTLPAFELDDFLYQIGILRQENKHRLARLLLLLAESKIRNTGEQAATEEYSMKELIDNIQFAIYELEMDYENCININFDKSDAPENQFPFSNADEMINQGKINTFLSIEKRLIEEHFFTDDGSWSGSIEVIIYLIKWLDSNGFFKRRTDIGRWNSIANYCNFFVPRYWVDFSDYFEFNDLKEIGNEDYLPWLKEFL